MFISYTIEVEARDAGVGPLTGTSTIIIHVLDINDNGPLFVAGTYTVNILENTPITTSILKVLLRQNYIYLEIEQKFTV